MQLKNGIDHIVEQTDLLKGKRWGLLTNNVAQTITGMPSRLALLKAGVKIDLLFSPEHGLHASGADGLEQPHTTDTITGLPVRSLYNAEGLAPNLAILHQLDGLIFDIPDVGCRFYTYLWSLTYCMEACRAAGIPLIVLDRPNPTGGHLHMAEGPMLDEQHCSSFIGRWSIPVRHCCTLGELALYFRAARNMDLNLEVVHCTGWENRNSFLLHPHWFHPTSPAIRHISAAMLYPGTGLFEGLNLNEGRGTNLPFEIVGAPWIDPEKWLGSKTWQQFGVSACPVSFVPASGRYANEKCHGLQLSVSDESMPLPVTAALELIQKLAATHDGLLTEAPYPTMANPGGLRHLDLLLGVPNAYQACLSGELKVAAMARGWKDTMQPFLRYF